MQPNKNLNLKTIIFLKMEDDLNLFEKGRHPNFFENRRQTQKNNATKTIKSKNNNILIKKDNLKKNNATKKN